MSATRDHAHVIAPPPLITLAVIAVGLVLHGLWPVGFLPQALSRVFGIALLALSPLPGISAILMMRRAHTSPMPETPTSALVTSGPFRFTRNPIYLTFALFVAGLAVFINGLLLMVMLPVLIIVLNTGFIEREEAYLTRLFGEDYRQYRARVRRWL